MKKKQFLFLAILSGLLMGVSFPSIGFPLLFFFALVPLLWIEYQLSKPEYHCKRKAVRYFFYTYISFFIFNAYALRWLFGLEESRYVGYFFPISANALFMALIFTSFYKIKSKIGAYWAYIYLPLAWISFEKLHLEWSLSFPWLTFGNTFAHYPKWIQWYEYTGALGGTLWIWLVNLSIFFSLRQYKQNTKCLEKILKWSILNVLLIGIPLVISIIRFNTYEASSKSITACVLQPNLNPYTQKFNIDDSQMTHQLIDLVHQNKSNKIDYIISPETALTNSYAPDIDNLNKDPNIQQIIAQHINYPNTNWIMGTILRKNYLNPESAPKNSRTNAFGEVYDIYNAAIQLHAKDTVQVYKKSKLVIGVETLPFSQYLQSNWVKNILLDFGGTVSTYGTQIARTPLKSNLAQVGVAICYESDYGEFMSEFARNGAQFLCVITNDGWWSNTDGHRQHLNLSQLRAIESRRSIARSANTGISAFINEKGEVVNSLAYAQTGFLTQRISLNDKVTLYSQYGDVIARFSIIGLGCILGFYIFSFMKKKVKSIL